MSSHHIGRPTAADIFRYRYQHGVNLAGVFVLEQWLYPSMFDPGVTGSSELDAVVSSLIVRGLDETRRKWEDHWNSALTDDDFEWLARTARCNSLRLPIGYFTLGPAFCNNTPFSMLPAEVYVGAWDAVKKICRRCCDHGIGVLIDFQAAPGGANAEAHSGTSVGRAELWGDRNNLDLATGCLLFIAEEVMKCRDFESVLGLQICSDAVRDALGMYDWYTTVADAVASSNPSLHVYVSDAGDLRRSLQYAKGKNLFRDGWFCPIVVDVHRYFNYGLSKLSHDSTDLLSEVSKELLDIHSSIPTSVSAGQGAVAVYVGEYSCGLPVQLSRMLSAEELARFTSEFGHTQSKSWESKASGSAFFTWKLEGTENSAWSFPEQVKAGAIAAPSYMRLTVSEFHATLKEADCKRTRRMVAAMNQHCAYFDKIGGRYEHWRYADGWDLGWTDSRAFFSARRDGIIPVSGMSDRQNDVEALDGHFILGADKIGHGMLDLWIMKRLAQESEIQRGSCEFMWEWEQGFRAGFEAFHEVTGLSD